MLNQVLVTCLLSVSLFSSTRWRVSCRQSREGDLLRMKPAKRTPFHDVLFTVVLMIRGNNQKEGGRRHTGQAVTESKSVSAIQGVCVPHNSSVKNSHLSQEVKPLEREQVARVELSEWDLIAVTAASTASLYLPLPSLLPSPRPPSGHYGHPDLTLPHFTNLYKRES